MAWNDSGRDSTGRTKVRAIITGTDGDGATHDVPLTAAGHLYVSDVAGMTTNELLAALLIEVRRANVQLELITDNHITEVDTQGTI